MLETTNGLTFEDLCNLVEQLKHDCVPMDTPIVLASNTYGDEFRRARGYEVAQYLTPFPDGLDFDITYDDDGAYDETQSPIILFVPF